MCESGVLCNNNCNNNSKRSIEKEVEGQHKRHE